MKEKLKPFLKISCYNYYNSNYSLLDWIKYFFKDPSVYMDFNLSDEFKIFSLLGKTEYQASFYNINGDKDYQTNFELAGEYFKQVNAPTKKLYVMKDTTHGLLESKSEEFSKIIHEIANLQKDNQ